MHDTAEIGGHPDQKKPDLPLSGLYELLRNSRTFEESSRLIREILEPEMNQDNCFWLSHAWAESLISGRTISVHNFQNGVASVSVRHDPLWKKDHPDYRGVHFSHGAEAYMLEHFTRGRDLDLKPRQYNHLTRLSSAELKQYLDELENGQVVMLHEPMTERENHITLAAMINQHILMIGNYAFHKGPAIDTFTNFLNSDNRKEKAFTVFLYPEKIHGFN